MPPLSGRGGEGDRDPWRTPATCAGITFMITEEGAAQTAGTYTPARSPDVALGDLCPT